MEAILKMAAILNFEGGSIANIQKYAFLNHHAKFHAFIIKPAILPIFCTKQPGYYGIKERVQKKPEQCSASNIKKMHSPNYERQIRMNKI